MDMEAASFFGAASASFSPAPSSSRSRGGRGISRLPARVAGAVVRSLLTFVFASGRWIDFRLASVSFDRSVRFDSCAHCVSFLRRRVLPLLILLLPCWFVAVGMVLGAVTGALIGLATESGLVRGAGIGAISGVVVSMEVVDSSVAIWRSDESGIWSVLYVVSNCTDDHLAQ